MARKPNRTEFTEQEIMNLSLDTETNAVVPQTTGLQWIAANDTFVKRPFLDAPPRMEIAYSGNDAIYIGYNLDSGAATTDATWIITKNVYDSENKLLRNQTLVGAWDSRTGLSWGI